VLRLPGPRWCWNGDHICHHLLSVLAPIPVAQSAPALAFFAFLRNLALVRKQIPVVIRSDDLNFGQIWGVTIGGTVLQNQLTQRLPLAFLAKFPGGVQIAFEVIPSIRNLPQPLKDEVCHAFAGSLQVLWNVLAGICGAGFLVSFFDEATSTSHLGRCRMWER
jgi:hypothetical protein